jgi:very-short-patch-repair endonuclease
LPAGRLKTALRAGTLVRVLPGVYALAEHAASFVVRAEAACLWHPDARLAGRAALYAWGLVDDPPATIEVAMPREAHRRYPDWLQPRRRLRFPDATQLGSLRVVPVIDALLHGFGESWRPADDAVYRAVRSGLASVEDVRGAVALAPRVRKRRQFYGTLEAAARGAESYLEARAMTRVFNTAEFASLIYQHDILTAGRLFRLDAFDAVTRTAIECDGAEHHASAAHRQRDVRRDALLAGIGIQTLRFTYADVVHDPEWCRSAVRAVLAARQTSH